MVTMENLQQMKTAGIEVISCGANVPFADPEIFLGATGIQADAQFALLPDFIANCGMARVFAYLMQVDAVVEERAIFDDVSSIIHGALHRVLSAHTANTCITEAAFSVSLDILQSPIPQKA
jgi:glutamate dehydrogenase/leucine dehydrogenase